MPKKTKDATLARAPAHFRPETINPEERTVDVVFTTGAGQVRYDYARGIQYEETILVSDSAVDLGRLNRGAPLLDSHVLHGVRNQLGVVERAWLENGEGVATVRFSERAMDVFEDVAAGIVRNVSMGFMRIRSTTLSKPNADGLEVRQVVKWEPYELSFVTAPVDAGSQVRGLIEKEAENMDLKESNEPAQPVVNEPANEPAPTPATRAVVTLPSNPEPAPAGEPATEAATRALAEKTERERVVGINAACDKLGVTRSFADKLIADGVTLDAARGLLIDEKACQSSEEIDNRITPGDGQRESDFVTRLANGILHRERVEDTDDPEAIKLAERSLAAISKQCAEIDGMRIDSDSPRQIATRAVTSVTLGNVVALVAQRTLTKAYDAEPRTFLKVFREGSAKNFQQIQRVKLSDAPKLALVPEGDPITEGTLSDSKEVFQIATYGKIIAVTRQMIINDDFSAIARVPQLLGAAAAVTESDVAWGVILANAALSDTREIFNAVDGNVEFSSALDAASLEAARAYFRGVTTENGAYLNLTPKYLVVGQDLEVTAERLLRPPMPYQTGTITDVLTESYRSSLELVVEPRVTAGEWFLFADTSRIDTAEYAWLQGQRGPVVERDVTFNTKNVSVSVIDDFGAGVIDRRGMFMGTDAAS